MKEKSISERVMMILGIIFGFVVWVVGLIVSLLTTLQKKISSGSAMGAGGQAARIGEQAKQAVSDVKQRATDVLHSDAPAQAAASEPAPIEPDIESGEDTVVQGLVDRDETLSQRQHEGLGGIPEDTDTSASPGGTSPASAYSHEGAPYDADISDEGVVLNDEDETDRSRNIPLDEGIPNLGEPGDVEDAGPALAAEESVVEDVEDGVPEEFGQDADIDSVSNDQPWVADAPGVGDDIPAASRGYREYGESAGDEEAIEDMADTEGFGLDEDVNPSGAGGVIDLENDEAPSWGDSGMSIVDDPDAPILSGERGPLDGEETLGLRDSEFPGVSDDLTLEDRPHRPEGEHLGISGDFEKADDTETIPAVPTEEDTASGDDISRESFVTGDEADRKERDAEDDSSSGSGAESPANQAGYSAAWSTPAGRLGQSPEEAEGTGFENLAPGGDEPAEAEGAGATGEDTGTAPGGPAAGGATGGTGSVFLDDLAGGDPADLANAAVGDLGTATAHPEAGADITQVTITAGHERDGEPPARKSRKQRRQQSDWVPEGAVRGDGNPICPDQYPIKGNANSRIYHRPTDPSYAPTIPEYCFATEDDAQKAGFRAPRG